MSDCIFCKIIKEEIPCYKILETKNLIVFLDISQATKGHTLIVSKKHYRTILETPSKISEEAFELAKKLGQIYIKVLKAKGINILTNAYEAAGQSVPHFHIHVIPRYGIEDKITIKAEANKFSQKQFITLCEKIKKSL